MDKENVVAAIALKAIRKEMRLRETISEPAYAYYCRGGTRGVISGIVAMCWVTWMLIRDNVPAWGVMFFALAMIGFLESGRQRDRFNALVDLMEIEDNKTAANNERVSSASAR